MIREGVEVIRHSTAHLMAQAVKELFPEAQVTIGPVIEDGFYYDFRYDRAFTPDDLEKIEKRMEDLAQEDFTIERSVMERDDAVRLYFERMGEEYKVRIIQDIPSNQPLSFYKQGEFIDLCRGPHVPSTGKLKGVQADQGCGAPTGVAIPVMNSSSGSTARPGRIKKSLKAYLHRIEGSGKARSPQGGQETVALPYAGRSPGHGFLASQGLGGLSGD